MKMKEKNKITVGIVGYGVLGKTLDKWLKEHTNHKTVISDPPLSINDDLSNADIFFISIHIETDSNGLQDINLLKEIISKLPNKPIFIRTTLKPGTTENLAREMNRSINFMPEFLTERTAYDDFKNQPLIYTNHIELLKNVFLNQPYIEMSSTEAEISKYAHNVFGALKVTYFNAINDYCNNLDCDYNKVYKGIMLSQYINKVHSIVPGPDNKLGYGGKCFPKDVKAFEKSTRGYKINYLIKHLEELNNFFRK